MSTEQSKPQQVPLLVSGHSRPVVDIHFSPEIQPLEYYLISSCKDSVPILRHGVTGDWIGSFIGHKGCVWCARLDQKAEKAVTASADFSCKVWDAFTGDQLVTLPHKHIVKSCDFSEDAKQVVSGGMEQLIRIFDLEKPNAPTTSFDCKTGVKVVYWGVEPHTILSSDDNMNLKIWDIRSGQAVCEHQASSVVQHINKTWDGEMALICTDPEVSLISLRDLSVIKTVSVKPPLSAASLSPDNSKFVGAGKDNCVYVFDAEGAELDCYKGHHGPVHDISFSPDGKLFASGSEDGTLRLWQSEPGTSYGLWLPTETHEEYTVRCDE
eukprot:GCRY01000612.1.p1 GENE.GCRY01000612.1~~GCRY01000612.1.p1  ORF type:complete len:324 (+),score=51.72 GCRY01000612.1:179-1150(+)